MYADNQTFLSGSFGGGSSMGSSVGSCSGLCGGTCGGSNTTPSSMMTSTSSGTTVSTETVPDDAVVIKIKEFSPADIFTGPGPNPELVVFDLDWTLWQFDCDKHVIPPFTKQIYFNTIYDRYGRPANPYTDVPAIISALVDANIPFAIASRNPSAGPIEQLLRLISIFPKTQSKQHITNIWDALPSREYFHAYSSDGYGNGKDRHFKAINAVSGVPFNRMLFFDDLPENIKYASIQGTTSVLVSQKNGLNWSAMIGGITEYRKTMYPTVTVSTVIVTSDGSSTTSSTSDP
jgi:magnesium-dependent phosphatase 1